MNSNHITYEPASCNRQAGRGVVCLVKKTARFLTKCHWNSDLFKKRPNF